MQEELKTQYAKVFQPAEDGEDIFQAQQLKLKHQRPIFGVGLCLGLILACVVLIVFLLSITADVTSLPAWSSIYPIFRGSVLFQLACWYIGINMYGWKKGLINFRFIAEIGKRRIAHQQLLLLIGLLSFVTALLFTLYLFCARGDIVSAMPPRYFGFIQVTLSLGLLLFPFNYFYRNTRIWLLKQLGRIVCAPFFPVRFTDFFLADQLTSLVIALYDLEFSLCFVFSDVWTGGNACLVQATIARFIIAGLPGLWRFLQCLRRYRDSKDMLNLVNAGKYGSGLVVVILAATAATYNPSSLGVGPIRICLFVFSAIATGYGVFWDLTRDFGFCARKSKHRMLRNELLYSRRFVYYLIIPADIILRCAWILTISPESLGFRFDTDLVVFVVGVLEITRRFLWNFFRMENEQATNCGNFRAVKDVPLPLQEQGQQPAMGTPGVEAQTVALLEPEKNEVAMVVAAFEISFEREQSDEIPLYSIL